MKNKKVCHMSSAHPHTDIRIFVKELSSIAKAGYETYFVVPNTEDHEKNGVKIRGVTKVTGGRLSRMTKTVRMVFKKAYSIDADVYHFHDPELIFVGLLLKLLGKKVVYDVHEDVPRQILSKYWIKKGIRKLISSTFEMIENFAARRFDAVVTATPFITERFAKIGSNAVNVNNYPILGEFIKYEIDWSTKENSVIYIGSIEKIRGLFEMVEAIGLTNAQLLLAGKFDPESLKQEAEEIDGWDHVVELGFLDRKSIAEVLSKSVAGLVVLHPIPNYLDSLPIKMFEYMSAGIPVIASNFPLWEEIVTSNQCGVCVDPLKPNQIADAIMSLVDNPVDAQQMGINGRKAVIEKYNWEIEERKLLNMYSKLLN